MQIMFSFIVTYAVGEVLHSFVSQILKPSQERGLRTCCSL